MGRLAGQFKPLNLTLAAALLVMAASGFLWRSNQMSSSKLTVQRPEGPTAFVHDYGGIITTLPTGLNQTLQNLIQTHDIEIVIVTIGNTPDEMTLEQLALKLIDSWQIGAFSSDRGLLLLVAADSRKLNIGVSAGLKGIFTDTFCRHIQNWQWQSLFDTGKIDAALSKVVAEIENRANLTLSGDFTPADIQSYDQNLPPGP